MRIMSGSTVRNTRSGNTASVMASCEEYLLVICENGRKAKWKAANCEEISPEPAPVSDAENDDMPYLMHPIMDAEDEEPGLTEPVSSAGSLRADTGIRTEAWYCTDPGSPADVPVKVGFDSGELVTMHNGRPMTTSIRVAESFEKRHDDVLKSIRNLGCSEYFGLRNFAETSYKDVREWCMARNLPPYSKNHFLKRLYAQFVMLKQTNYRRNKKPVPALQGLALKLRRPDNGTVQSRSI